ncbi:2-oxo acid dehydrogenase subunit E2 [Streptomyces sp. NPDC048312]|uniref:Dihydrolipoamide acetyltransferase component of pyruvate dehydrogenase complex n=1 Tax=Streptomyces melanovinaceus TaxID=1182637 RepID=I3QDL9_9ACTN|nr:QncL [Streptomyces melanovinaceus]AGD95040.1 transketolase central region [Streptomyces melanovinaceus]BAO84858.1 putative dehydrogenase beta subunit [Streptomyces melanovinaceus]
MTRTRTSAPRVAAALNEALHTLFAHDEDLHLLGEDIVDPYGGAFKITKGLSTRYPDRVLATPLSEGGIIGVAGGLALCGTPVIAEIMFGDFVALGFDQILNFASKSVSMYGTHVPMPLVIRCPVGGNRGYGPTHSQSPQKHFIGIPNLTLYELSPFHDPHAVLDEALRRRTPAILFEDKVLYTRRMHRAGRLDDTLDCLLHDGPAGWAHIHPATDSGQRRAPDAVIIAAGGVADRAIDAAHALAATHGVSTHVLVPARLYPLNLDPVLPVLRSARRIAVVEEGTAGGTWGSHVAAALYPRLWEWLDGPILLLSSADSIIPTAAHLEQRVLLDAATIEESIAQAMTGRPRVQPVPRGVPTATHGPGVTDTAEPEDGTPINVPKLNNNDTLYRVVEWLYDEGAWVAKGTAVVSLETSKAIQDIDASESGYLHRAVLPDDDVGVGAVLGHLLAGPPDTTVALPPEPAAAPHPAPDTVRPEPPARRGAPASPQPAEDTSTRRHPLDRAQLGTAEAVARSHAEIPAAFTALRVDVDRALDALDALSEASDAIVGLPDALVKAVATAHESFPLFFGRLESDGRSVALAEAPHVGVTIDVGSGLFVPVVHNAHTLLITEIADMLMDFRMTAFRTDFTARQLDGGTITISLNPDPGVVLVQPIVLWPQLCMLSVGAVHPEVCIDADTGTPTEHRCITLGLAYDHRVINGRDAALFLTHVKEMLQNEESLARLLDS